MVEQHRWGLQIKRYPQLGKLSMHSHAEPWFCMVLEGGYLENGGCGAQEQRVGNMLFCPAELRHSQQFGPNGATKLLFTPAPTCLSFLGTRGLALADASHTHLPSAVRIGERIAAEIKLSDSHSGLALEELMLDLMGAFAQGIFEVDADNIPNWLARVREAVEDNEGDRITLDDLALIAGRHPVHVARAFRRHYGRTIGHYLREKRIVRAALLLCGSTMPLAEIALVAGYGGQPAFTRAFGAVYGMTPSVFRARMR